MAGELPRSIGWLCGEDTDLKLFRIILCAAGSTVLAVVVALFGATWPLPADEHTATTTTRATRTRTVDRRFEAGRTLFTTTVGLYNLSVCVWLVVGTWSLWDYGCLQVVGVAVATAGVVVAVFVNVAFTIVFLNKWSRTREAASWKATLAHRIVLVVVALSAVGHLPALSLLESRLGGATSLSVPWPESGRAERLLWLRRCGLLALAILFSCVATLLYQVWSATRCSCNAGSLIAIVAVSLATMLAAAVGEWVVLGFYWILAHLLNDHVVGAEEETRQPLLTVNETSGDTAAWVATRKAGDAIVNY